MSQLFVSCRACRGNCFRGPTGLCGKCRKRGGRLKATAKATCHRCGAACRSRPDGLCGTCRSRPMLSQLVRRVLGRFRETSLDSPEREARIRLYTERAAAGLPLFTREKSA